MVTIDTAASKRRPRPHAHTRGYKVFRVVNVTVLILVMITMLYPFLMIVAQSFSSDTAIRSGHVSIFPVGFNLTTYRLVMGDATFWTDYRNTVVYTAVATLIAIVLTTCYAYVISKKHLRGRGVMIGIAVFTMFFNGGLIPNYILITSIGFRNTIWAIVLPNAISVFNLLVMKSFFENLPLELMEAAQIDGRNTYGILWYIVLPLSKAVLATMVLFYAVSFWNSWFSAFLYMDKSELFPVTVYLRNLIAGASSASSSGAGASDVAQVSANIQSVTMVLTVLPILCIYPFVQRYFVSGVMLGSVKG